MARLSDVDKLVNDIANHITVKAVSRVLAIIQGQPTVEAIPVEWIKKYYEDITIPHTDTRIQFEELIRKWKKENE